MASAEDAAATRSEQEKDEAPVGMAALSIGIFAAPLAWSAQELVSYGFVSGLCRSTEAAAALRLAGASVPFLIITAVTLAIALAGAALAWRNWKKLRGPRHESNLSPREIHAERSRFMARVGLICSVGALCAFAFTIATLFTAPLCPG